MEGKWGKPPEDLELGSLRIAYPARSWPPALASSLARPWGATTPDEARFVDELANIDPRAVLEVRSPRNAQALEAENKRRKARSQAPAGDPFPAEISSLLLSAQDPTIWQPPILLGFLASDIDEGVFCARGVRHLARKLLGAHGAQMIDTASDEGSGFLDGVYRVPGLQMTDPRSFLEVALPAVADAVIKVQGAHPGVPLVLDVSGGFKGLIPFSGLLGTILDGVTVQSVFEFSDRHVRQPPLPVQLDAVTWSAHRAVLSAIEETCATRPSIALAYWEALPERLRGLWLRQPNGSLTPNPLAAAVKSRTDELLARGAVAPHQHPTFLRPLFQEQDTDKAEGLLAWFAQARNIWLGDLIPETVDHGRGHAQRLCELAYQVLRPITQLQPDAVSGEEMLALLATLWVHDVGHASHRLPLSVPSSWADDAERKPVMRDISAFPSLVRDFHSFTACERLLADPSFEFPPAMTALGLPLRQAVALGYRYHRSKLKLKSQARSSVGPSLARSPGVQICWGWVADVEKGVGDDAWRWSSPASAMLVTALQRVIDGADVQTERAGDAEYRRRRELLTRDELSVELDRLLRLRVTVPHLWRHDWTSVHGAHFGRLWNDYLGMEPLVREPRPRDMVIEADGKRWLVSEPDPAREKHMGLLEAAVYRCLEVLWALPELDAGEAAFLEYLSAFDRVVFKYPQMLHFDKHAQVLSSAFRPSERFGPGCFEFDVVVECAPQSEEAKVRHIVGEIASEASAEVREVLARRGISIRKVEARRGGVAWFGQEVARA
jgi:hypothetical protein